MNRPQHTISGILGLMKDSKSPIPLAHEFGQRVFDPKTNRWIKREEAENLKPEKAPDPGLKRLEELEKKRDQGLSEFLKALEEIKENKLYLLVADTWGQYCKERLGRSRQAVWKMLEPPEEIRQTAKGPGKFSLPTSLEDQGLTPKNEKAVMENQMTPQPPKPVIKPEVGKTKAMPQTQTQSKPEEEDLLDEIITRIQRARTNQDFLKALKEWLDESGI